MAALAIIPVLLGAIATVHVHKGFFSNAPNGGWEYPVFWIVALVVQAMLGDGTFAVGRLLTSRQPSTARTLAAE